ncbi:hypothetical protein PYW08_007638 [Mythimna loreyi]|uniref:Uncharacterized protein n=1 Tax=Mythimna loreyi TaxID=667449 RepID=A0ACC2QCC8_9NEOP|nr:hypothetical protein PYW08_007638 [Mythimna loreyi]
MDLIKSSLLWMIVFMLRNPEEIPSVCQTSSAVSYLHFERLNNLIEEGMRLFSEVHYGERHLRYQYVRVQRDLHFERLNNLIEEGMRLFGEVHYGEHFLVYNYLPGKARAQEKVAKNREEMFAFYQTMIDDNRETLIS